MMMFWLRLAGLTVIHSHIHSAFVGSPLRSIDSIESDQLFEWDVVKSQAARKAAEEAAGRYTRTIRYASYTLVLWPYKRQPL